MSKLAPTTILICTLLFATLASAAEAEDARFLHGYPAIGMPQIQMAFRSAHECELNLKNGYSQINDKTFKCESEDLSSILIFFVRMIKPLSSTDPDEVRFSAPFTCDGVKNQILALGKKEDDEFIFYCGSRT